MAISYIKGRGFMREAFYDNQYRTTVICIDTYEDGVLDGRMYNPYLDAGISFHSTMEFLKKLDYMLVKMNLPQSFSANKAFRPVQEVELGAPPQDTLQKGKAATFAVNILFRQNASWQGLVTWSEGHREKSFRSVLELLLMMDSALEKTTREDG